VIQIGGLSIRIRCSARKSSSNNSESGMTVKFVNSPIAERPPRSLVRRSAARACSRLDRAARSEPDLFADVHQGRLL